MILFSIYSVMCATAETQVPPKKVKKGIQLKTKRLVTKKMVMNTFGTIRWGLRSFQFYLFPPYFLDSAGVFGATTRANVAYLSRRGKQVTWFGIFGLLLDLPVFPSYK